MLVFRNFDQRENFLEELIEGLIFSLIISGDRPIKVACLRGFEGGVFAREILDSSGSGFGIEAFDVALGAGLVGGLYINGCYVCLLYTSPSPRDLSTSRMPSSA